MLLHLEMENFRKIVSKKIDFTSGVNGIFGPNYTGKTTTLMAIAVAIGGPSAVRGRNLVNRTASNFFVALDFTAQGINYRVERTKNDAKLFKEGNLVATKQTQVNASLSQVLGVPVADWLALRFVEQKQAAAMFLAGAAELNRLIERTTGVQVITHITGLLATEASEAEAVALALQSQVLNEDDHKELLKKLEAVQIERETTEATLGALKDDYPGALKKLTDAKTNRGTVQRLREECVRVHNLKTTLTAKLEERTAVRLKISKELEALPPAPSEKEVSELKAHIEELYSKTRRVATLMDRLKAAKASTEKQATKLQEMKATLPVETVEDLAAKEAELEAGYNSARKDAECSAIALGRLREDLKKAQLGQHAEACPTCQRLYEEDEETAAVREHCRVQVEEVLPKAIQEEVKRYEQLSQRAELTLHSLRDARAKKSSAEAAVRGCQILEQGLSEQQSACANYEKELQALGGAPAQTLAEEELKSSQARLVEFNGTLQATRKLSSDFEAAKADVAEVKKQLDEIKTEAMTVPLEELDKQLAAAEEEVREASNVESVMAAKIEAAEAAATSLARELLTGGTLLQRHEAAAAKVNSAEERATAARGLQKYLREHKSRYVQSAWTLILSRASVFAEAATGGRISNIIRTEDGNFEFTEEEFTAQVGDASGAQAAILGLAIQAALAESLPSHLDIFVCDEPTADMDAEHSTSSLLALSSACPQTVVISHHRFDETLCNNVIEL